MFGNISTTFAKKFLYGALGNIGLGLTYMFAHYTPTGGPLQIWIWNTLIVGVGTGAAAALVRLVTWNPDKA